MSGSDHSTWNSDYRRLLREIRSGLLPPLANRAASSGHHFIQPSLVFDTTVYTMGDSPHQPGGPPGVPSLVQGLQRQVGRVEDELKLLSNAQNQLVGLPSQMAV